ncbi:arginine deiminase family protein [Virgibacillus salexigens]|uniref:arginine deiminase family protein n=1 Tax=Virgibacillus salexigens TaxID=61016 RepID=UPI0019095DF9|nr:arginine deiminase family protein [Virgibacillus salexigens]
MGTWEPGCWSEHGELKVVFVCSPSQISIPDLKTAEDVQWSAPVHHETAQANFASFKTALEDAGVEVIDYSQYLDSQGQQLSSQLINRFFVRDLACVFGKTMLPGEAGTFMRRPEYVQVHQLMNTWFPQAFRMEATNHLKALEFGDVLILNQDVVWINVGMRTSLESVEEVKDRIFQAGFSEIGILSLPRRSDTLHLDMNCNVAGGELMVAKQFVRHFPIHVWTEQGSHYEMPKQFLERHGFAVYWLEQYNTIPDINFLNLDPETILISKQAHKQMLKKHPKMDKKKIIEVDVTELEKAGGGIRCMTLPLVRLK